jgi:flagellar hook-basal body complex protein FliE
MSIDTRNIDAMLAELKATSALAQGKTSTQTTNAGGVDFSKVLQSTLEQVNQAQQSAQKMTEDFATGDSNVNLQDVMVNLQKANLSFQQMVQVRNKLVTAYNDIMNMQV